MEFLIRDTEGLSMNYISRPSVVPRNLNVKTKDKGKYEGYGYMHLP